MLTSLRLQNFRCFDDHVIPLRNCTIIVGRNNAGKSTLVDALRLVSIVTSRYEHLSFKYPPAWGDIPRREIGISPSIKGMEINTQNIFHMYGPAPAVITAFFDNKATIKIYIGPETDLHAVIFSPDGSILRSKAKASYRLLPRVEIMPRVAPLARNETILNSDYVRSNVSSSLAPLHFRNQINLLNNHFNTFKKLSEETWPGLQIRELEGLGGLTGSPLDLMVRNDNFVAEAANMGHGLQMWLQWFLSRANPDSTVILDEPDVYMHPDLRRRLVRHLRNYSRQIVVTTHSVEIMSEVEPDEILILDKRQRQSNFAISLPAVQKLLDHVGSAQNLQLTRLWRARKIVFVEGKDFRLLSDILM
jgi:energy-coupling factor transporter ATP-binding protein EcfA2